jgi:hypothetical protein
MPTPNPSALAAAVTSASVLFTANWATFVTALVALIGIIVLPTLVIRGGIDRALSALRSVFGAGYEGSFEYDDSLEREVWMDRHGRADYSRTRD